ncbi:MAG: adenylyltransferase/cytidyltransferase family protein [Clostridium sp.]|uniref:adenylyltransferase/cytidyltransferase family protein n=1 Tax=Clostridium TaxID=1485 RepID=UPI0028FE193B|nr:adenylyltransferase/cytidyltransferase family protein [Clostridium sp.]MDU1978900.1 adenylyltransferase/cytidyltransferase family protein [Clostridium sp.]MDU1994330.1 adenylyltransferase/cytidyltransferase family protein [Clostridium sp.]MDU4143093.1 adenylyltransferase/cytidyltransferase family protein [Clostridium sp.]MDU6048909.1 adenylyltransferase/cytidyltransferase family protein [Clostridium sp.]MDU6223026.1 adenylyltransferase/cytidyltransferase family protein [Clostridium sp.]
MKKYKLGYTTGVYDLYHVGHLNVLRNAKEKCDFLIVGVTTDELCYSRKNKYPIIPLDERMAIIESVKYVDLVVVQDSMDKIKAYEKFKFDVVFVGDDWKGTESWNKYEVEFNDVGVDVVYLKHTDGISSSIIRGKIDESKFK